MKAVQVVKYGDAVEGVELRELPEPNAPKTGEVLVAVEFSPINFNDLMVVWGIYSWRPELPATMGNEGAGKVVAVGEGVTAVRVGAAPRQAEIELSCHRPGITSFAGSPRPCLPGSVHAASWGREACLLS